MKPNKSHTKLYVFLLTLWEVIKDALSPSWAASMPAPTRKEETIPSRNGDEQAQNTVTPMDSSDLPSSPSSGPTETAEGTSTPLAIQADRTINEAALAMNEEIVRLRERLKELEKDAAERIDVARTMDELRACAKRERENSGKIGRPPKQYKKVTIRFKNGSMTRTYLYYPDGNLKKYTATDPSGITSVARFTKKGYLKSYTTTSPWGTDSSTYSYKSKNGKLRECIVTYKSGSSESQQRFVYKNWKKVSRIRNCDGHESIWGIGVASEFDGRG